jgi:ATP-dependent exoDNAse (exonuclease V) alpha subunit
MAIVHLRVTPLSRLRGANALETAAQYAATVLVDQRSGQVHDFRAERGVLHQELFGPEECTALWQNRERLWNAAEQGEARKDARVAREYQLGLRHELSVTERIELARRWGRFLVERYGNAVDLTVHAPPEGGDPRNHYAKVLATTRQVTPTGLGAKTGIELRDGAQAGPKELRLLHEKWKQWVSEALTVNAAT